MEKTEQLKKDEYECVVCHKVFKKGRTDEEALREKDDIFPGVDIEDCDLVCDDCFNKMNDKFKFKDNFKIIRRVLKCISK